MNGPLARLVGVGVGEADAVGEPDTPTLGADDAAEPVGVGEALVWSVGDGETLD